MVIAIVFFVVVHAAVWATRRPLRRPEAGVFAGLAAEIAALDAPGAPRAPEVRGEGARLAA